MTVSPPFNINELLPGDSDIVSQHPFNARTFRDTVESWLLIDHDNLGQHNKVTLPWITAPATPAVNLTILYVGPSGNINAIDSVKGVYAVGPPVGSVFYSASANLPTGYLRPDGSAVSRSTFSALFSQIGTTYGPGDGSTTFNLPNLKGRVIAGYDAAAALLSTAGSGVDSATLGGVGGVQNHVLTIAQLPPVVSTNTGAITLSVVPNVATGRATNNSTSFQGFTGGSPINAFYADTGATTLTSASGTLAIGAVAVTSNNTISTAHPNVQPTIILQPMIKY